MQKWLWLCIQHQVITKQVSLIDLIERYNNTEYQLYKVITTNNYKKSANEPSVEKTT